MQFAYRYMLLTNKCYIKNKKLLIILFRLKWFSFQSPMGLWQDDFKNSYSLEPRLHSLPDYNDHFNQGWVNFKMPGDSVQDSALQSVIFLVMGKPKNLGGYPEFIWTAQMSTVCKNGMESFQGRWVLHYFQYCLFLLRSGILGENPLSSYWFAVNLLPVIA